MFSDGDYPTADYDENTVVFQGGALEDDLGTQVEDSNDVVRENIDLDYDPYSMLEEAPPVLTTNTLEQSNYRAPHISEDREKSIHETVEDECLSVRHNSSHRRRTESPQTSQDPSPTQRSRESTRPFEATSPHATNSLGSHAQEGRSEDFKHAHFPMSKGSQSPVVKMEEPDDDVFFIKSNTLAEAIIISDDEDVVEPKSANRTTIIDTVQRQSSDPTANCLLVSRSESINMGKSILQTRTTQRKHTRGQIESMKKAQLLLAKQSNRKSVTGGAGTVFQGTAGQSYVGSGVIDAVKEGDTAAATDENAWMNEEMADDSDDSVNSVT